MSKWHPLAYVFCEEIFCRVAGCVHKRLKIMSKSIPIASVKIEEYNDGFAIVVGDKRWTFNQEEDKEKLVEVFKALGFKATYEEVY